MPSPLVEAAADYLSRGLKVIALTGKTPNVQVHRHGLHEPLVGAPDPEDFALLESVFDHPATTGVGILTSWPFVVVDVDGEEGAVQWSELVPGEYARMTGWAAKTGRGLHLWFMTSTETGTIKLGPKLDLKGDGGYVAAPPSAHPDGGQYEWLSFGEYLPPPAPAALQARIDYHVAQLEGMNRSRVLRKPIRPPRYELGDTVFHAQPGFESVIAGMAEAAEGNRNNYLHWAAATLAEEGGIDEDFEDLRERALSIGLEPVEVTRTLRSARRRFSA